MKSRKSSANLKKSTHEFEVFFDGDCPLCRREIGMIRRKDKVGRLLLTDISDARFVPSDRTMVELMKEIHGRHLDGSYVTGVEVFRQIYRRLGFGFLVSPSRLPVISHFLQFAYTVFAKLRFWAALRRMRNARCTVLDGTKSNSKCGPLKRLDSESDVAEPNTSKM